MSLFNKKKKKEHTPQQKVKRAVNLIIGFAVLFVALELLVPNGKHTKTSADLSENAIMDLQLDSLIEDLGFEGFEVFYIGDMEHLDYFPEAPVEDTIFSLTLRKKNYEHINYGKNVSKDRKYIEMTKSLEDFNNQKEMFYADPSNRVKMTCRRIKFKIGENDIYTGYQNLPDSEKNSYLSHVTSLEK